MKRHPDGRFRGNRDKIQITDKVLISRWVEKEVIRVKRMGVSFETIADLLTRAGRGEHVGISLPPDVTFPPGYSISKMGCCKAYRRRMEREPSFEAREHRSLDIERYEELCLALQASIKKGDPKAIEAGVRVLALKAKVIGYPVETKTVGNQGPEKERGVNKEPVYPEWDDNKTITMFEQAVALLAELKPPTKSPA